MLRRSHRFPLPVSCTRAPLSCARSTAWLALALAFASGFTAAVYTVGFILTAR